MATRAKLFLNTSLDDEIWIEWPDAAFVVPAITSVEPPVEGLARSIMSFGIGIVLLSRLTAVGTFYPRYFCDDETIYFYCWVSMVWIFSFFSDLSFSFKFWFAVVFLSDFV